MKQTLRIITVLILLACTFAPAGAQENGLPGDDKFAKMSIQELTDLCNKYDSEYDDFHLKAAARRLMVAAIEKGDELAEGNANYYLGTSELFSGDREKGLRYLWKAKNLSDITKNDTLASSTFNGIGIYENMVGSYYLARWYYLEALGRARRANYHEQLGIILANLSELSIKLRDRTGMDFAKECFEIGQKKHVNSMMYDGATNMAVGYYFLKDYKKAEEWVDKALAVKIEENITTPIAYANKAEMLARRGQHEEALKYANMAIASSKRQEQGSPLSYAALADAYFYQGNYAKALEALDTASKLTNDKAIYVTQKDINLLYAKVYAGMKNYQKAFEYEKKAHDAFTMTVYTGRERVLEECRIMLVMLQKDQQKMAQRAIMEQHKHIVIAEIAVGVMFILLCIACTIAFIFYRKNKKLTKKA